MHECTGFQRDARAATADRDGPTGLGATEELDDEGDRQGWDERLRERVGSD